MIVSQIQKIHRFRTSILEAPVYIWMRSGVLFSILPVISLLFSADRITMSLIFPKLWNVSDGMLCGDAVSVIYEAHLTVRVRALSACSKLLTTIMILRSKEGNYAWTGSESDRQFHYDQISRWKTVTFPDHRNRTILSGRHQSRQLGLSSIKGDFGQLQPMIQMYLMVLR